MLFYNSIKFPNTFSVTNGDTSIESNITSINRCIALILTTAEGELLMNPDFGCTLYERLFSAYTEQMDSQIKAEIAESINTYEQRAEVDTNNIMIEKDKNNDNKYYIHITYHIKNSDMNNNVIVEVNDRGLRENV